MSNHGPLRRGASPEEALEALGDFGAPGGVAELEKNLIDRPLLLNAEGEAHMQKRYRETTRAASVSP
jgi:hypothetical protein